MPRVQDLGPGGRGPLPELRGPFRGRRADRSGPDGENPRAAPGRRDRPGGGPPGTVVHGSRDHREAGSEPPPEPDRPTAADPAGIGPPNSNPGTEAPLPRTPEICERGVSPPGLRPTDPARNRRQGKDQ